MRDRSKSALIGLAVAGLLACCLGILQYARGGFSAHLWLFWLVGYGLLLVAAFRLSPAGSGGLPRPARRDWLLLGLLLLIFAPLYVYNVHDFPRQMNTDEIAIMASAKHLATTPNIDVFEPSYYSDLPTMVFWALGKVGLLLGGVTLGNMRLVHATSGVLILLLTFLLLRLLRLPRYAAFAGVMIIGLNHSLLLISRMAMRDNTALLMEVAALLCLVYGRQKRNYGWSLLGGIICGFAFYSYYPGRITMFLWLAFVGMSCLAAGRAGLKELPPVTRHCAVAVLGLVLITAPLYIATARHTPTDPYASQQFLWQAAARNQEKAFRGTATTSEAIRINALHGLGEFNLSYSDQGLIYDHPGFGFTDKITGFLLWLGVLIVILQSAYRRRVSEADRLALVGFFVIYLSEALLLTRAPDYTRLLIVLPFVGYLVGRAVMGLAGLLGDVLGNSWKSAKRSAIIRWSLTTAVVIAIAIANSMIIRDFQRLPAVTGDGVADTLRFQEKHDKGTAQWLFAPGDVVGYYQWGIEKYWEFWFLFGVGTYQTWQVATPQQLISNQVNPVPVSGTGYLMTTRDIWLQVEPSFAASHTVTSTEWLDAAHNRIAVTYQDK